MFKRVEQSEGREESGYANVDETRVDELVIAVVVLFGRSGGGFSKVVYSRERGEEEEGFDVGALV